MILKDWLLFVIMRKYGIEICLFYGKYKFESMMVVDIFVL